MIKQVLHNFFSITLAFLVLFSTVSLTVEKHFCGDVLVDVSIFTEGEKCAMEAFEMKQAAITKKNCCKDQIDFVQGQKDLAIKNFDDLEFEQQLFLTSFAYIYINLFEGLPEQIIPHKDYSPPNLIVDLQLVNDTFLI
ncbi:hypothetical protein Q4512_04540 [Oceanihabitans sp. 2_MG-2023]|uniref:HYC_CC_PP family protein n=1 Tax=Oceanihabitans sp. 2_MG-2023 TaxID=3062661 RepID=UPI0026E323A9|nr:hypothetical protein [Oceanihabitans sp. 2_MG-2023]MDO6596171.1 hypothetical protein [Oceanihabitans sp. 2_MG-2023]